MPSWWAINCSGMFRFELTELKFNILRQLMVSYKVRLKYPLHAPPTDNTGRARMLRRTADNAAAPLPFSIQNKHFLLTLVTLANHALAGKLSCTAIGQINERHHEWRLISSITNTLDEICAITALALMECSRIII